MKAIFISLISLSLTPASSFTAAEPGSHGAHAHGVAQLTLAQEGQDVEILLTSPAISVVGFEHRASSPQQRAAVADAKSQLLAETTLFSFKGTDCALQSATVDISAVLDDPTEHDHHNDHDEDSHTDISAHYEYRCTDSAKLDAITIGSTGLPFSLEAINAIWVSDRGQGAATLNAENRLIEFN